jgi:hypothetical protein
MHHERVTLINKNSIKTVASTRRYHNDIPMNHKHINVREYMYEKTHAVLV